MGKFFEPLKHLDVSPLIREIRNRLLALQQKEYSEDTLKYLQEYNQNTLNELAGQIRGKPFQDDDDLSLVPDQIIQIKNLSNALYLAERVFEQLEQLNLADPASIDRLKKTREQADEASRLLLALGTQVGSAFNYEITTVLSWLTKLHSYTECSLLKSPVDPSKLTTEKISELLKNHVGCIQYQDDIYYFNNTRLQKISTEKKHDLLTIMNEKCLLNECRIASGPEEIKAITDAIGQSPFLSNFFESPIVPLVNKVGNTISPVNRVGLVAGNIIDQMKPAAGQLDYDLLSWSSGVLPFYIEKARVFIETSTVNASFSLPDVDEKEMANVVHNKLHKLSNSMQKIIDTVSRIKDPITLITNLPALFSLPSHFKEIQPLLTEVLYEVEHLDDTVQHLVREFLARLKYEVLPTLLSKVDYFEMQMLLQPGRVSRPLMDQIKPLYDLLIQISKDYLNVKFNDDAERLLKLEDAQFIEKRLAPVHQQIDESTLKLHQITLTRQLLDNYLQAFDENQSNLVSSKEALVAHLRLLTPYLEQLDKHSRQLIEKHVMNEPSEATVYTNVTNWLSVWFKTDTVNPVRPALKQLKLSLQQMEVDQTFRTNRNKEWIESVYSTSNMTLFQHKKNRHLLSKSEKEAFTHRHSLSTNIQFDDNGVITNPNELTNSERWDLYQWYANKLTDIQETKKDCGRLLTILKANKERNKTDTIDFQPDYIPCLAGDKQIQHQPNHFYIRIENETLKYEVLEPQTTTPCSLLKLSQVDPRKLNNVQLSQLMGNRDGFIQYEEHVVYYDTTRLNVVIDRALPYLQDLMNGLPYDELKTVENNHYSNLENIRGICKLYLMTLNEAKEAGHRNSYVWNRDSKQLSYIDVNGQVQAKIILSDENKSRLITFVEGKNLPKIKELARVHREEQGLTNEDVNYLNLTAKNMADFIEPHDGHHAGLIRKGTIPLKELNPSLTNGSSIDAFRPYLRRIYDKALERGHIQNPELSKSIRYYSSIQPWLVEAFEGIKVKDVNTFDKDVVNFLSGRVYGHEPESRTSFSYERFRPQLLGLETELSGREKQLEKKLNKYSELIKNNVFSVEPPPMGMVYHHTFSPEVAEFMHSVEPIKRQLHESAKTILKVQLAREHLNKYCKKQSTEVLLNNPEQNRNDKHYPWFHGFLVQLKTNADIGVGESPITVKQLQTWLNQIQFYEESQIRQNKLIMESVNARNPDKNLVDELSESTAFIRFAPKFKPCDLKENEELKPDQLHLNIINKVLHYKFLHYGQLQIGEIPLKKLANVSLPSDEKMQWNKKTIASILSIAYEERNRQIQSDKTSVSFDEALELIQWYRDIQESRHDLSRTEQSVVENKLRAYNKCLRNKSPQLKIESIPLLRKSESQDNRLNYLIKQKKAAAALTALKLTIDNHYATLTEAFRAELKPAASGVPFPQNRTDIERDQDLTRVWVERLSLLWEQSTPYLSLKWSDTSALPSLEAGFCRVEDIALYIATGAFGGNWGLKQLLLLAELLSPSKDPWIHTPRQVLAYKRLFNIVFYLEKILEEAEKIKINKEESKLALVNHLLISYLYAADIYPLVVELSTDPHFSPFFRDILSQIDVLIKSVTDEYEHYSALDAVDGHSRPVNMDALYLMNVLKILPERLSLTSDDYKKKLPALKATSEKTILNIEKIINDYQASFSYIRLFFDLPIVVELLKELPKNIANFTDKINKRIKDDLAIAPPAVFFKIMREADKLENILGLKAGTLSEPLKKILDEFYKGLITPLILDVDKRVNLLCDLSVVKNRLLTTFKRELTATLESKDHARAWLSMQQIENASNTFTPELKHLYKQALPLFKKALNGSDLHFMSYHDAKKALYKDCFIWNEKTSQLFYIDAEGKPNDQNGSELYLKSIPEHELLTEAALLHNIAIAHPHRRRNSQDLHVAVNKPTLIKHGKKYFIYENATDKGWRFTALDADIIDKMHLDFNKTAVLERNKKYQDLYAEITAKSGWIYPIHLKSIYKFIEFIAQKYTLKVTAHPSSLAEPVLSVVKGLWTTGEQLPIEDENKKSTYLSETEIKHFISSNSHFNFQKNGVSLPEAKGCCFISMLTEPVKLDNSLKLPEGYSAYYVQVKDIDDALYHIDLKTRLIQKLDIISDRETFVVERERLLKAKSNVLKHLSFLDQTLVQRVPQNKRPILIAERDSLLEKLNHVEQAILARETFEREAFKRDTSKIRKNTLMLPTDFEIVKSLTGHVYQSDFISNPDEFIPNEQNIHQLQVLATQCKNHYEELRLTSNLAVKTAIEQQAFLRTVESAQHLSNQTIKQSVFADYFDEKVSALCRENKGLQGYNLELLTDVVVKIKPNRLYVNINNMMLHYKVLDPAGVIQKGQLELSAIGCSLERLDSPNQLLDKLPEILKITSRQGDRHTRPYSLMSEYQAKLKTALEFDRENIINLAEQSNSQAIDQALQNAKMTFEQTYIEEYKQLNAVNMALNDFLLYLDHAEKKWETRQSLFESAETIRGKRSTLDHLNALASNDNDAVSVRIKKIQTYLVEDATLEHLLNYATYESNTFAMLFQIVLKFFEAVGLYTPKVVQHVDKLLSAIEGPTADQYKGSAGFLFFAESTRKSIRPRADKLKVNDEDKPDSVVDDVNAPGI